MMEGQGGADVIDNTPNISDVLAVIEEDEAATSRMGPPIQQSSNTPYIRIIEQPAPKETRFRYKCEGRSAGSIPGVSSSPDNKTHPKIQIMNFRGKGVIVVSCVTKNAPYRVHPHNLVGKDCNRGICIVEVEGSSDDVTVSFPNLGIQCVKRKDIEEELKKREEIRVDPFRMGFTHVGQPGNIDLNTVRLCFQAFIQDPVRNKLVPLQPVVSEPVHDKKAVQELTICKLSQCSGSAGGGTDIILLCEKVVKEDIAVRFFEEKNGQLIWEGYADFTPQQVHKQFAISFKTPKYATLQIEHPVQVSIELRRPSDGAASDARQFTIYPIESGTPPFWSIRRSIFSKNNSLLSNIVAEVEKPKPVEQAAPVPVQEEVVEVEKIEQDQVMEEDTSSPKEIIIIDDDNNNKEGGLVDDFLEQVKDLQEILPPGDDICPEVYSSMQMAMKNPMDMNEGYEDIAPPRPTAAKPQVPVLDDFDDIPAPPLPPKRAKKSPNNKNLPPIPEKTKLNIFQKLFCSAKRKKAKSLAGSIGSKGGSTRSINSEVIPSKGMDLTEAEHYALYTTFAPKATLSECDDMSFYYSTVEGQIVKHQNV